MPNVVRFFLLGIGVLLLLAVRGFEEQLFYDPLLEFYKVDHQSQSIPPLEMGRFFLNLFWRYGLNTALSLGIIALVFQNRAIVKVAALLYAFLGVVLFLLVAGLLLVPNDHVMALFYVRRFLIHPVLLLILLPAFYFQRKTSR
jgi:exosortase F-associated protein